MVREHGKLVTKLPTTTHFLSFFLLLVGHVAQALANEVTVQKRVLI